MTVEQVPLQILAIDGGGYQGIASLLILDELMKHVAGTPGGRQAPNRKPIKPCDMFDVIGGVGSGGWLALLLGRFRLTISECLHEYLNIVNAMTRRKISVPGKSSSSIHRNVYDMDALIRYVEYLTHEYGTGEMLLDSDQHTARCKHTFVVACCKEDEKLDSEFCVFRTYKPPEEYSTRLDPAKIRISHAFAAAGAKKGYLYPFKLPSATGSTLKFGKEIIPEYFTNATIYALKEIRQQFGVRGAVPAIINIGPGIPNIENIKMWGKMREKLPWTSHKTNTLLPTTTRKTPSDPSSTSHPFSPPPPPPSDPKRTSLVGKLLHPHTSKNAKRIKRSWSILEKIKTSSADTELQIRRELGDFDPRAKYVRLVLDKGPKLTAYSDLATSQEMQKCTEDYLSSDEAQSSMRMYGELIPMERAQAVVAVN